MAGYNPKNPGGKNSPENMALFQSYSAEAFKAARGQDIAAGTLETLTKSAATLTEEARRKLILSNAHVKQMAKSIAAMNTAAQSLRSNPKDLASIVSLGRSMTNVARFRQILSASGVSMPSALSRADFAARGHINQITGGQPVAPILNKMLQESIKENKREEKRDSSTGYGAHLQGLLAKHIGKSGFFSNMASGALTGEKGLAGRLIGGMGPAGIALGAAAVTAGAVVAGINKLQDLQKDLVNKAKPYSDYLSNAAQVSRFGNQGSVANMPFELSNITGTGTAYKNLSTLFPQFTTTNGLSPAAMEAMAASGIPIRNLDEGAHVLRTIYGMQSGGAFGGMGTDQLANITKQLYGFGFASRGGGNMVNTQAASVANNVYASALQTGVAEGFDKSSVAQAIQDSLEAMAKQGGINATMPAGLMNLFAANRSMAPGAATPGSVVSAVQGISTAGGNILSNPALMVGLQNYVQGHYKGGNLAEKIQSMGKNNPQIRAFTKRFSTALKQNPAFVLETMAEGGMLDNILPASLNSLFMGGKGGVEELFRIHAAKGVFGTSIGQSLSLSNVHGAISGGAGGLDDHSKEMLRLHKMLQENPTLQTYMKMLQTNPAAADNLMRLKGNTKLFKSFFGSPVFGSITNPLNGATLGGQTYGDLQGHTFSSPTAAGTAVRGIFGAISQTNRRNAEMMADVAQGNLTPEEQRGQGKIVTSGELVASQENIAGLQGVGALTAQNWLNATAPMLKVLNNINANIQSLVTSGIRIAR